MRRWLSTTPVMIWYRRRPPLTRSYLRTLLVLSPFILWVFTSDGWDGLLGYIAFLIIISLASMVWRTPQLLRNPMLIFQYGRGRDALLERRYEDTYSVATQIIERHPNYIGGYWLRASALLGLRDYDAMEQDVLKMIDLKPQNYFAFELRASMYTKRGDYDRAIHELEHTRSLKSKRTDYYLGYVHMQAGNYDLAEQFYGKAEQERYKGIAALYNDRAVLYIKMERFNDAARDYQHALRLDEHMGHALNGMGYLHLVREDATTALEWFQRAEAAADNDRNRADALARQAIACYALGQTSTAAERWRAAESLNPDYADTATHDVHLGDFPVYHELVPQIMALVHGETVTTSENG